MMKVTQQESTRIVPMLFMALADKVIEELEAKQTKGDFIILIRDDWPSLPQTSLIC